MSSYKTRPTPGNTEWFTHDRFGMFIHWGLYALPARNEWIKQIEHISEEHYDKYFKYFDPDLFQPEEWAKTAREAGMKYVVITSKHHDGFCLFDSKYTDYKATNTPAGRDLLKECIDAFRKEGLRIGLYYSLLDWHHPHFTIDLWHPRAYDDNAKELNEGRDMKIYAQYMRDQVREIMTNYGQIDIMWFDWSYSGCYDEKVPSPKGKGAVDWEAEELIKVAREINPEVIIDNRTEIEQDLWTPEQYQVTDWKKHEKTGELVVWEACHTLSGSWSYHRDEASWKSPEMLISMLIQTVSHGGNFMMNVGPTSRGYLDKRAVNALEAYHEWMQYNSRSIYGCTKAEPEFQAPYGCIYTQSLDGKRLYVHLTDYPFKWLALPNLAGKVDYAQFLFDGSELEFRNGTSDSGNQKPEEDADALIMTLPIVKPNVTIPVIELFLK